MSSTNEVSQDQAATFAEFANVGKGNATEWVVIHMQLIDEETGRCAVSPPMCAMTWEMGKTIFNSLIEAALISLRTRQHIWLAKLEDSPAALRVGFFPEKRADVVPVELVVLMDKRELTAELYEEMYLKDANCKTFVRELPLPEAAPKKTFH